ncbi:phosphate signaling complex protein PhoU [Parasulfuritortus cantonensis]|uniref:Phosphate-specific transport system accessory protein PhoU n=1 Tax=Parasulfuritortus cantonensis TaxID=2528202 RepID=A0A4R1BCB9_9PROT|nr:phosphate signaling complex protein PhoU [Parasulfuritortus cantonensis]TCJ14676.1 phosphate signaling complex protein PhoU [Parasulfuritortus cantonensis]
MDTRYMLEAKKHQIEVNLAALFDEVGNAIDAAIRCLVKKDQGVCEALIRNDVNLNEKRRLLEQDCLVAIASQQPVAHDLRDIIADMRITSELERMGDYAADIAASVLEMDGDDLSALGLLDVQRMSGLCQDMLSHAMRAHRENDAALARRVGADDDELDALLHHLSGALMDAMRANPAHVHNGSRMLWIAHNLERCGDRATNIAEQVIFRVEGVEVELN